MATILTNQCSSVPRNTRPVLEFVVTASLKHQVSLETRPLYCHFASNNTFGGGDGGLSFPLVDLFHFKLPEWNMTSQWRWRSKHNIKHILLLTKEGVWSEWENLRFRHCTWKAQVFKDRVSGQVMLISAWSRGVLEKLIVSQLLYLRNGSSFYRTRRFSTVYTRVHTLVPVLI
jgi:hypothetical protein